jgi:hypothetical protein
MDYPQRFFTKQFSGARPLELARRLAIWSGICAALIAALVFAILWARRSQSARPYFLYSGPGGVWVAASEHGDAAPESLPWFHLLQEAIAVRYAADYFRITADPIGTEAVLWCGCNEAKCESDFGACRVCCASGSRAFDAFSRQVLPQWRARMAAGTVSELSQISARPSGRISEDGGSWRITGVLSGKKPIRITGFMRITRSRDGHGRTLGYFTDGFDFYRE